MYTNSNPNLNNSLLLTIINRNSGNKTETYFRFNNETDPITFELSTEVNLEDLFYNVEIEVLDSKVEAELLNLAGTFTKIYPFVVSITDYSLVESIRLFYSKEFSEYYATVTFTLLDEENNEETMTEEISSLTLEELLINIVKLTTSIPEGEIIEFFNS